MNAVLEAEGRVRDRVTAVLARELTARGDSRLRPEDQVWVYDLVGQAVGAERQVAGPLDSPAWDDIWRRVFGAVTPLGPLAEYLADPEVEEVRMNGAGACYLLRQGRRIAVDPPFDDERRLLDLVHWYTDGAGTARIDRASPTVTLTLPDGSRLHAALSPPARPMSVTIRRHPPSRFKSLEELAAADFLPPALIAFLTAAVRGRANMLVAGGTGTGKTTFVRVLCGLIPAEERLVTIEDHAELHLWQRRPDCVSLEGRPANSEGRGAISIQMLVHEALRMSPDRIVIGEVRGPEALDLLDAMNTGHPGSVCTIHSETLRDTLPRLGRLALRNPQAPRPEALLAEMVRTVDLVLHLGVSSAAGVRRRRLRALGCVAGLEAGQPVVEELVRFDGSAWGRVGAAAAMPDRLLAKLAEVADVGSLLDGL
jgi:pilus assembly protein CpaF